MLAFPLAQILSRTELNSTEFFLLPPPPPLPVPLFSSGEQWNCFKDSGGQISQSQGGAHNYGLFWGYRYCLELNSTEFLLLPPPPPLPVPSSSSGEQWKCFKGSGGEISQSHGGAHNYGLFWGYRYCLEVNSAEFLLLPPPLPSLFLHFLQVNSGTVSKTVVGTFLRVRVECTAFNSTEFLLLPPPAPPHLLNSSFSSSSSASFSSFSSSPFSSSPFSSSPFPPLFAFASSSPVLCLLHSVIVWFLAYLKDKSGKILSMETDSRFL